jgi:hypothetical protein
MPRTVRGVGAGEKRAGGRRRGVRGKKAKEEQGKKDGKENEGGEPPHPFVSTGKVRRWGRHCPGRTPETAGWRVDGRWFPGTDPVRVPLAVLLESLDESPERRSFASSAVLFQTLST